MAKLNLNPPADPEFQSASPFLKRIIAKYETAFRFHDFMCLDLPCGTGRNTFLLAKHFRSVCAADISLEYLDSVEKQQKNYPESRPVITRQLDLKKISNIRLSDYQLICLVHYEDSQVIGEIIKIIDVTTFLYVETPSCHGENHLILPTEEEIKFITRDARLLEYQFCPCGHEGNKKQRGSLKMFLQKINI
jgi:hypothetical protein